MDALNAVDTAAECAVLSEQSGLRGCILQNESWAENGHRATARIRHVAQASRAVSNYPESEMTSLIGGSHLLES